MDESIVSSLVVSCLLEDILDDVCGAVYDTYLRRKEVPYAVHRVFEQASAVVNSRLPLFDVLLDQHRDERARVSRHVVADLYALTHQGAWEAEEEVVPCPIDAWATAAVPSRRIVRPPPVESVPTKQSARSVAGRSVGRHAAGARAEHTPVGGDAASVVSRAGGGVPRAAGSVTAGTVRDAGRAGRDARDSEQDRASSNRGSVAPAAGGGGGRPRAEAPGFASSKGAAATRLAGAPVSTGRKGPGSVDSAAVGGKPVDEAKRQALAQKNLKGKTLALDERGNVVIVNPPAASRLPSTSVNITVAGPPTTAGAVPDGRRRSIPDSNAAATIVADGGSAKAGRRAGGAVSNDASSGARAGGAHTSGAAASPAASAIAHRVPKAADASATGAHAAAGSRRAAAAASVSAAAASPSRAVDASTPAAAGGMAARDAQRFFRQQPGVQPPVSQTLAAPGAVAPGVVITQAGTTLAGPGTLGAGGAASTQRGRVDASKSGAAPQRSSHSPSARGGGMPVATGSSSSSSNNNNSMSGNGAAPPHVRRSLPPAALSMTGAVDEPQSGLPVPDSLALLTANVPAGKQAALALPRGGILASIPDIAPPVTSATLRSTAYRMMGTGVPPAGSGSASSTAGVEPSPLVSRASSPGVAATAAGSDASFRAASSIGGGLLSGSSSAILHLASPKPGSGLDFRARAESRAAEQLRSRTQTSSPPPGSGLATPIIAPLRSGDVVTIPPRASPTMDSKVRAAAVGEITKRPRDRASATAATLPVNHLPPPLFPAVAHYEAKDDDDMLVLDGSVQDDDSEDDDGLEREVRMPSRMHDLRSASPSRSPTGPSPFSSPTERDRDRDRELHADSSIVSSPTGVAAAPKSEWGLTAARRGGGVVRVSTHRVSAAGGPVVAGAR